MDKSSKEYLESFISDEKDSYYRDRLSELLLRLIKANELEKLQYLKKIDIPIESNHYCSLILAAREGNLELVNYFLSIACDINDKNNNNETIFHAGVFSGNLEFVKFLSDKYRTHMQDPKLLSIAIDEGHLDVVKFLVEELKIDIHSTVNCVDTVFFDYMPISAMSHKIEIFNYLISKGGNIHQSDGYCLNTAIRHDNLKIAAYLIKHGLNVNHLCSVDNKYPIEYAKNSKTLQFLLKHGADINIKNSIVLLSSLKSYNIKLATLLIQHGCLYQESFDKLEPPISSSVKKICQAFSLEYSLPKKNTMLRKNGKI